MFEYRVAGVVKVVDGDTVDLIIDLGFRMTMTDRFRLYGINAPESNRKASRVAGKAATEWLKLKLLGRKLRIHTIKVKKGDKRGKYGRWLAIIFREIEDGEWENVNLLMVKEGHALEVDYD
jgi:micrococcal nuclease